MMGHFFLLLFAFVIVSCSPEDDHSSSVSGQEPGEPDLSALSDDFFRYSSLFLSNGLPGSDLVTMNSKNRPALLGTNLESAKKKEQPQMMVFFSYDFLIGQHEVTCGEYNFIVDLANAGPHKRARAVCEHDSLPVANVTYYDAVLFANGRSRLEGRDTVYEYKNAIFDNDGHCIGLDGFVFHPEVKSYRLPTEAEWTFAAQKNWDIGKGWTSDNSDYKPHKVCTAGETAQENGMTPLCDMVGNVMEWANDWLGDFRDTAVFDYMGAADGGGLEERVVKGGSYRNAASTLNIYNRGDIYTVTSSTRAEYVGFRLAMGAVPKALWMGATDKPKVSQVAPLAEAAQVNALLMARESKLVFRNDLTGNLVLIDYDGAISNVVEIVDTIDSYHPEISPDGKKVAFCTSAEGVGGKSELYVRNLSAAGSNLVKLNVESAAIPRWRVTPEGDTVIVYVTDAGNNKNDAEFLARSTWQVPFMNGQFGIPSKLYDGNYHGGVSGDAQFAVTGSQLLRAHIERSGAVVDSIWYNGEQACNVSLSKDGTKRTLFLDFGGKTGRAFAGSSYGSHEQLLVVDSAGNLIQMVPAPSGYSFDHSEWTFMESSEKSPVGLAVASLANVDGAHEKLVLVNFTDSSVVELVEGDELWHPNLWIRSIQSESQDYQGISYDSAGHYLSPFYYDVAGTFRIKMESYWKTLNTTRVVVYGSSRVQFGVLSDLYPEWNMLNMGVKGVDIERDLYFAQNYALNHSQNLSAVAISLDIDTWRPRDGTVNGGMLEMVVCYPGYIYDKNHNFWKDGVPDALLERVEYSYSPSTDLRMCFSNSGSPLVDLPGTWETAGVEVVIDSLVDEERMAYIDSTIEKIAYLTDEFAKHNVHFIGIIFPQAPQYRETGSFGLYGLQWSVAEKVVSRLDSLAKVNPYFHLMDENKMGKHDYGDEDAMNRDHLCFSGAGKLTQRLVSLLESLGLNKGL